jgi:hypothetical protein
MDSLFSGENLMNLVVGLLSATASVLVFGLGIIFRQSQVRNQRAQDQITRADRAALEWGAQSMMAMSRAHFFAENAAAQTDFNGRREALMAELSALVDHGRLYFPNESRDLVGTDREAAMRGYRPAILDALLLPFFELLAMKTPDGVDLGKTAGNIYNARRAFISELQDALDPKRDGLLGEALKKRLTHEEDWVLIRPLVESFAERHGRDFKPSFWPTEPQTRSQLERRKARTFRWPWSKSGK